LDHFWLGRFTFCPDFCGFPPIVQRAHNGWGTAVELKVR
jgi:hypothetical protein